ncbi:MAG: hypothetical protein ACI9TF_001672, partial [Paracrocinitomix sp.]
ASLLGDASCRHANAFLMEKRASCGEDYFGLMFLWSGHTKHDNEF